MGTRQYSGMCGGTSFMGQTTNPSLAWNIWTFWNKRWWWWWVTKRQEKSIDWSTWQQHWTHKWSEWLQLRVFVFFQTITVERSQPHLIQLMSGFNNFIRNVLIDWLMSRSIVHGSWVELKISNERCHVNINRTAYLISPLVMSGTVSTFWGVTIKVDGTTFVSPAVSSVLELISWNIETIFDILQVHKISIPVSKKNPTGELEDWIWQTFPTKHAMNFNNFSEHPENLYFVQRK